MQGSVVRHAVYLFLHTIFACLYVSISMYNPYTKYGGLNNSLPRPNPQEGIMNFSNNSQTYYSNFNMFRGPDRIKLKHL